MHICKRKIAAVVHARSDADHRKAEDVAVYLAKKFSVPDNLVRDQKEREEMIQMMQQMQMQQQQQQQQMQMQQQQGEAIAAE